VKFVEADRPAYRQAGRALKVLEWWSFRKLGVTFVFSKTEVFLGFSVFELDRLEVAPCLPAGRSKTFSTGLFASGTAVYSSISITEKEMLTLKGASLDG
jgi:hypothetical protein